MDRNAYYDILGVGRTASAEEIKRAYRKLARTYHPDVNSDPEADVKFKQAGEAFAVLGDPEKRAAYDAGGPEGIQPDGGSEFTPPPEWEQGFSFTSHPDSADHAAFGDFFEDIMRGAGRNGGFRAERGGQDQHAKVTLDLTDVFAGATRVLTLRMPQMDAHGRLGMVDRNISVSVPKGIQAG